MRQKLSEELIQIVRLRDGMALFFQESFEVLLSCLLTVKADNVIQRH